MNSLDEANFQPFLGVEEDEFDASSNTLKRRGSSYTNLTHMSLNGDAQVTDFSLEL